MTVTTPPPHRRNFVWYCSQKILRLILYAWNRYQARGYEQIAPGGGLLLVNHQSSLDPVLAGLPLSRPISFLARETLFRIPLLGTYLKHVYVMPINRESAGTASIRKAIGRIEQGYLVGIFPEGTRSEDGQLAELKPGFVALVRRARAPVHPVGIAGSGKALPPGARWLRPRRLRVVFGPPIPPEELTGQPEKIAGNAHRRIAECLCEAEEWLSGEVSADKMNAR